jgi:hypothetical protein
MRPHMTALGIWTFGVLAAAAVIVAGALATQAEARSPYQHEHGPPTAPPGDHPSIPDDSDVMTMPRHMIEENNAADARLRLLVEKMNALKGQAKMDAMAAVVAELVEQHSAMRGQRDRMARMCDMMPSPGHGATADMQKKAGSCPMKGTATPAKP